jgi:UDP-2-acetamido-3-amino-2,3-dideoxy-glucuronate N-acetyltransferase
MGWDILIENDVFIGPNVTFTNDPFPRSKQRPEVYSKTIVKKGASIGANATILPGINHRSVRHGRSRLRWSLKDVPPNAIVAGNPAQDKRVMYQLKQQSRFALLWIFLIYVVSQVPNVRLVSMPQVTDMRGSLTFGEYDKAPSICSNTIFCRLWMCRPKKYAESTRTKRFIEFLVCIARDL